jgi:hypothetical protein
MTLRVTRILTAALLASVSLQFVHLAGAQAQSGDPKAAEKARQSEQSKDAPRNKGDDLAEVARSLPGPAGNPECVWLGRRVVNLLWRDDLDTAFRHLDLYDRFGCPGGHIQATFRCVVRQGNIDPKVPESLATRIQACWINPALPPTPPATASTPPSTPGGTSTQ